MQACERNNKQARERNNKKTENKHAAQRSHPETYSDSSLTTVSQLGGNHCSSMP